MPKDITYIAQTNFRGADQKFGIRRTDRRQHMYVIGKTGTGKTQFLKNMALQDVENGEGLAVIDPHGEFVEEILESIPRHRMKDVVYFNPADMDYPVSFNIMDVQDPRYKHLIASGLIGIFTKIWANVWSARMEYILANSILALLDTPGTTLLGIPRMLVDRDYRQKIINNLQDPVVKSFWINEYEEWESRYRNEAIAPVQNKVGQFLNVSFVRNIVGQAKNTIDIEEIMNNGKILLVNVSKGRIGEDNSAILGAMIITKIQLSAMERVRIPEGDRRDFYLYVDEFQNFATDSFRNILSEARKYRLNLIMAHQYIGQLVTDKNTAVRDAVFGNVGTEISFRVGAEDAEFLEKEFTPEFLQDDFVRLANRDTYIKLMIGGITSRPFSAKTITIPPIPKDDKKRDELIDLTREKYARTKQAVEDEINRWAANLDISSKGAVPAQWQNAQKQPQGHKQQDGTMLYDAVCSSCGKKTKVVFEPTSGKPVYCKSCFKKRKDEGLDKIGQPNEPNSISVKHAFVKEEVQEQDSALASLGIEFGSSKIVKKVVQNQPVQKPQQVQNQAKPQVVEPAKKIENVEFKNAHYQKYTEHQSQYQNQPQKREINLAELRKALAESLEKEEKDKSKPTFVSSERDYGEVKEEMKPESQLPKKDLVVKEEASKEVKEVIVKPEEKPPFHEAAQEQSSFAKAPEDKEKLETHANNFLESPRLLHKESEIKEEEQVKTEINIEINKTNNNFLVSNDSVLPPPDISNQVKSDIKEEKKIGTQDAKFLEIPQPEQKKPELKQEPEPEHFSEKTEEEKTAFNFSNTDLGVTNPPLSKDLGVTKEEKKPEPLVSEPSSFVKAMEDKQEIKPLDNKFELKLESGLEPEPQNQWPELKPKEELVPKVVNSDDELQKRIAQEKMSDEIQKNLAIDFSDYDPKKKGIIKPGETVKF